MTDLDEIEAAYAAATPGPWEAELERSPYPRWVLIYASRPEAPLVAQVRWSEASLVTGAVTGDRSRDNPGPFQREAKAAADFIANARQWVPELVAEVRRLRALRTLEPYAARQDALEEAAKLIEEYDGGDGWSKIYIPNAAEKIRALKGEP